MDVRYDEETRTTAAAPSLRLEELAAVIVPLPRGMNAGWRVWIFEGENCEVLRCD